MAQINWPPDSNGSITITVDGMFIGTMKRNVPWAICLYDPFQDETPEKTSHITINGIDWTASFPEVTWHGQI